LLLAQDFGEHVEWAMNWFFEKENTGDRGREWASLRLQWVPVLLPNERLKVGVEMLYKNTTVKDTRAIRLHSFVHRPNRRVETDHANSPGHLALVRLYRGCSGC